MVSGPEKLFYKRGEVCQIVGIPSHEMRTWENEFSIRLVRSASGQSLYRRKEIDLLQRIKTLVYDEKMTISGARKRLELTAGTPDAAAEGPATGDPAYLLLTEIRSELRALLTLLGGNDTTPGAGT